MKYEKIFQIKGLTSIFELIFLIYAVRLSIGKARAT